MGGTGAYLRTSAAQKGSPIAVGMKARRGWYDMIRYLHKPLQGQRWTAARITAGLLNMQVDYVRKQYVRLAALLNVCKVMIVTDPSLDCY